MPDDPEQLLIRAVSGDSDSLAQLLRLVGPGVRTAIASEIAAHWRSSFDDEDVMQVTYLEAFLQIKQFKPDTLASFKGWLLQIAKNNMRDAIKWLTAQKRPDPVRRAEGGQPGQSYVDLVANLTGGGPTPSSSAARLEARQMLENGLSQLPEAYRRVVVLYDLEERPVEDVGRQLERSPGAVFMLRARAHDRLKGLLPTVSNFFSTPRE